MVSIEPGNMTKSREREAMDGGTIFPPFVVTEGYSPIKKFHEPERSTIFWADKEGENRRKDISDRTKDKRGVHIVMNFSAKIAKIFVTLKFSN